MLTKFYIDNKEITSEDCEYLPKEDDTVYFCGKEYTVICSYIITDLGKKTNQYGCVDLTFGPNYVEVENA